MDFNTDNAVGTAIGMAVAGLIGAFTEWVRVRARAHKGREKVRRQTPTPTRNVPVCELEDPPPSDPPPRE